MINHLYLLSELENIKRNAKKGRRSMYEEKDSINHDLFQQIIDIVERLEDHE